MLNYQEERALEFLTGHSITSRYAGDLERWDDYHKGGFYYVPLDKDHVRHLLWALRGDLRKVETLDAAFNPLTNDGPCGAGEWPHGWCDDDHVGAPSFPD